MGKSVVLAVAAALAFSLEASPVKVIFDTDMYNDYDDVGAIAMLHALADAGECEILAMGTCTWGTGNRSVAAVEALNGYYGRPDIPLGSTDHGGRSGAAKQGFGLPEKYPQWVKHLESKDVPWAVEVYRKALEAAPDGSVTMVSVGFLNNMADLVRIHRKLVAKKVKLWVVMACSHPIGRETNAMYDPTASNYAFRNWPSPIIWTDWQYGATCYAGRAVANLADNGNPVRDVFAKMLTAGEPNGHPSWDQTAVLIAVRGWEPYFSIDRGRFEMVGADGDDRWVADPESRCGRITEKMPKAEVGAVMDELMCRPPLIRGDSPL